MQIRPGIKLLDEIEGWGVPLSKGDSFEAVFKFYRNNGEPLLFDTCHQKPIPTIIHVDGQKQYSWTTPELIKSNIIYDFYGCLKRSYGMYPGIYYSMLGMKTMGYRHVRIAPHFMARSMAKYPGYSISANAVIKAEIFLIKIEVQQGCLQGEHVPATTDNSR
jgi:hypothetical protein